MRTLFLTLTLLSVTESALACSCIQNSVHVAAKHSDAIFSGWAMNVTQDPLTGQRRTALWVARTWKGSSSHVVIETAPLEELCGFTFVPGHQYLVYARNNGGLTTSYCSRTTGIEDASADLAYLGSGAIPIANFILGIGALVVVSGLLALLLRSRNPDRLNNLSAS